MSVLRHVTHRRCIFPPEFLKVIRRPPTSPSIGTYQHSLRPRDLKPYPFGCTWMQGSASLVIELMITRNTRDHPYQNPLDMFPSWRQFPIFNNSIHSDGLQHPSKLGTTSLVFHHFIFCLACIQESVCSASPLLVKILFVT